MSYSSSRADDRMAGGTMTATVTASQVSALNVSCFTVLIQSDPNNSVDVYLGNSLIQPIHLLPGQSITVDTNKLPNFYAVTTSGSGRVNWLAIGGP